MNNSFRAFLKRLKPSDEIICQLKAILKYGAVYFAALLYWELLIGVQIGLSNMSFYFILFLPAEAVALALLNGWAKKSRINRIVTPIVMVLPFAYYVSQLVYYRIFGSLFSVSMIGMGADAVGDFGWALADTLKDSVGWVLLCLLPIVGAVLHAVFSKERFFESFGIGMHLFSIVQTVCFWLIAVLLLLPFGRGEFSPYYAYTSSYIDTDTASSRIGALTNSVVELGHKFFGSDGDGNGELVIPPAQIDPPETTPDGPEQPDDPGQTVDRSPNIIDSYDFAALKELTKDKDKQELCDYFGAVSGTNKNEYTGLLKDYNLIYICAEAFSVAALDPDVTPTLYKMSQGGIVLSNYYNAFKNTTTNGEFAFMTGLWPDVSRVADANSTEGSFVQSKDNLMLYGLGSMFSAAGVNTYSFHNFMGYYYQRNKTHKNLGYESLRFMGGKNGMTFTSSWPSSDLEMMEQSVDDFINDEQFHAYYMTFSGHGPYSGANPIAYANLDAVESLLGDRELTLHAKYYLSANYELEKAMAYLLDRLEEAGKLDNTMIVLTGDHYPYYLADKYFNELMGEELDPTFEKYKSSCIMYCPGIETVQVDAPCSNVDILPTVLNLFGLEYDSRLLAGTDILSDTTHIAMLYNKSFITDKVKYNAQNGKAQWLPAADSMSDADKQTYLDYCISVTKARYIASLDIMSEDFYRFIVENTDS